MTSDQIQSIIDNFNLQADYFIWQGTNANELMDEDKRLQDFYLTSIIPDTIDGDQNYEKVLALMEHTGDEWDSAESDVGSRYFVYTDEEAEKKFVESIRSYAEDRIQYEIPDDLVWYFDREAYIEDLHMDRGQQLASYDGEENSEVINGTTYYIYKQ